MSEYKVVNPANGETVKEYPTAADDQIKDALERSHKEYASWKTTPVEQRVEILRKVAAIYRERSEELAKIIQTEMGKVIPAGQGEVEISARIYEYYADNAKAFIEEEKLRGANDGDAYLLRKPTGSILGIMPWNFPYYQIARFAAPNLMLGNAIVLKHAEICPRSALAVQQIMDDAGVPAGVYTNVFATHDQIAEFIADPRVAGVSLTGSERAGSVIGALAGQHLKKAVLELGGSDPYIVLDAEDPAEAARTAWATRMYNMGQACNSNKRMIVSADIHDAFVAELVSLAEAMKPGEAADEDPTVFTPLSSRGAAEGLAEQVERARQQGATVHVGGTVTDEAGARFAPAVITGVTSEMDAYREELFGPVAVVYKVESADEALALANDSQYGLGGAVFSQDEAQAERIARQLEVGMANVNTPAGEGAEIPFGGVKRSGFGRELGPLGMDEFVNKQMYFVQD